MKQTPKTMYILMSHAMTPAQKTDAQKTFGIENFEVVPSKWWGQIPAEADSVKPYTEPIKQWLDARAAEGDVLLVQGDFGATADMIAYARSRGVKPVYATTRRVAEETVQGDSVITTRRFEHVRFREYE